MNITTTTTTIVNIICFSDIRWWASFLVSGALFVAGLIIIGLVELRSFIRRRTKPTRKVEMMRRKSRLLMNPVSGDADSDNDNTPEEEKGLSSSRYLSFRIWCEMMTSRSSAMGRISCLLQVGLNLLSWTIYLVFTHYQSSERYLEGDCYVDNIYIIKWLDLALNIFFALHFALRAFASNDILKLWVLPTTLVDICVIPNIIITSFIPVRRQGLSFLRAIYLRYFVDAILVTFGFVKINSKTQIFMMIVYLLSIWMIGSGFIHLLENIGDFWTTPTNKQEWSFWECCYFMLVTVATVGYGDYCPKTILGRLLVCIYIIYAIAIFASSMPQIVYTFKNSKYHDRYVVRSGERHMILTGQFVNSTITTFLKTFINKRIKSRNMKIIIMNTQSCDRNLSIYLKTVSSSIKYLVGNPRNPCDMKRASVKKAKFSVILAVPFTFKEGDEDSENIMTAIALKAQKERIRIIVQLHLYSNKILLKMFPRWNKYGYDIIVCMDELRLGLMAYNCLVPGIATLITNLMTFTEPIKVSTAWRRSYEEGLKIQLYSVEFSDDFHGMSCLDVSIMMYNLWDVCLLAVKYVKDPNMNRVAINPMAHSLRIDTQSMIAIVMARDEVSANRVSFYCQRCSQINPYNICICQLQPVKSNNVSLPKMNGNEKQESIVESPVLNRVFSLIDYVPQNIEASNNMSVDATGSFYWTQAPDFDNICIDIQTAEARQISDHILLCLCGPGDGTIDLSNFMMPLRFRSLHGDSLRPIVILGNKKNFEKNNWTNIKNFPMFMIVNGSPIQARDLRAAGIFTCYSCAIVIGNGCSDEVSDKQSLFCATLIRSMIRPNRTIQMITEIRDDEAAFHFSSSDAHDFDYKVSVQHTEPYARGLLFTNSILYRCIYSIYYNPDTFSFVSALIGGPYTNLVEKMFGSGVGLLPKKDSSSNRPEPDIVFELLNVNEPPFNTLESLYDGTLTYEVMLKWALTEHGILCMGLHRLNFGKRRYVFTHPPKETEIFVTDKVYCSLKNTCIAFKS